MTAINGVQMRLLKLNWRVNEAEKWLHTKHADLGGKSPNEMIRCGNVETVHLILDGMKPKAKV